MLKLMKYEYKKTLVTKLVGLGVMAFAELVFIIGVLTRSFSSAMNDNLIVLGIILLVLTSIVFSFVVTLEGVFNLYGEINSPKGYMLFMTPISKTKILGAKVISGSINIIIVHLLIIILAAFDIFLLSTSFSGFEETVNNFFLILDTLRITAIDWGLFLSLIVYAGSSLIFSMVSGTTAVLLGHQVGIEKSFLKGFITLVFFLIVMSVGDYIARTIATHATGQGMNDISYNAIIDSEFGSQIAFYSKSVIAPNLIIMSVCMIIFSICMFCASVGLLEKKTSL